MLSSHRPTCRLHAAFPACSNQLLDATCEAWKPCAWCGCAAPRRSCGEVPDGPLHMLLSPGVLPHRATPPALTRCPLCCAAGRAPLASRPTGTCAQRAMAGHKQQGNFVAMRHASLQPRQAVQQVQTPAARSRVTSSGQTSTVSCLWPPGMQSMPQRLMLAGSRVSLVLKIKSSRWHRSQERAQPAAPVYEAQQPHQAVVLRLCTQLEQVPGGGHGAQARKQGQYTSGRGCARPHTNP